MTKEEKAKERLAIDKVRTEKHFIEVCQRDGIKWGSAKFYDWQRMYFCGAMTMLNCHISYWAICLATNRPIMENWNPPLKKKIGK
jgi:hypothetical protein